MLKVHKKRLRTWDRKNFHLEISQLNSGVTLRVLRFHCPQLLHFCYIHWWFWLVDNGLGVNLRLRPRSPPWLSSALPPVTRCVFAPLPSRRVLATRGGGGSGAAPLTYPPSCVKTAPGLTAPPPLCACIPITVTFFNPDCQVALLISPLIINIVQSVWVPASILLRWM